LKIKNNIVILIELRVLQYNNIKQLTAHV